MRRCSRHDAGDVKVVVSGITVVGGTNGEEFFENVFDDVELSEVDCDGAKIGRFGEEDVVLSLLAMRW